MRGWVRSILGGRRLARHRQRVWRSASGPKPAAHGLKPLSAKFDSATTTDENRRHWAMADGLSPNAALSPHVRRTLRNRARYEVANNSYAKGIVLTLANDCVGTGPRLQMQSEDSEANDLVEHAFEAWAEQVNMAEKLRTMRMARAESGEAFAVFATNPAVDGPVQMDLKLVEPDQVLTPYDRLDPREPTDGIVLDRWGNPAAYHVLKEHPGSTHASGAPLAYDTLPAASVVHYYRADRPGQLRGIPDITPALPLFAQLRRYTLAVLAAAETAADFAAVIYTEAPANGEADALEPMDLVELEKRMATVMPGGWKLGQMHAEQPATTYSEFKREILNEIARCLNIPFNIAAGNSSGYNYASGRLDHQTYYKSLRVEQAHFETKVLDRIFAAWLNEALLVEGFLPEAIRAMNVNSGSFRGVRGFRGFRGQWFWDGMEHVDPAKEATAQARRLESHTTTLAHEYARQGRDWEEELKQRAKEKALIRELGLDEDEAAPGPPASRSATAKSTKGRTYAHAA